MKPVHHKNCNATLKGGAPHIPDLPVKREVEAGVWETVSSFWLPTKEELAELVAGGVVEICILGDTHPPISIRTSP
jgi:hypothetical protein